MDYGRLFPELRAATREWPAYTHHTFVEGMRDGSLPKESFLFYMRQDYVFLIHFARAWSLAVTKTTALDEMRLCAGTVNALINEEIELHIRTCAGHGISADDLTSTAEAGANLAYTRFVLDAGHAGDLLDLLVALAPCVLGYGEIGARLGAEATSRTYADWIDTYSGADYQDLCAQVGSLMDRLAERRIGDDASASARWPELVGTFRKATALEVDFWQMGLDRG